MTHIKILNARRGPIQKYEDLNRNLYKRNTNIYFNRQSLKQRLTPSYAPYKIPSTSPAHKQSHQNYPPSELRMRSDIYTPKNKHLTYKSTTYTYHWPKLGTTWGHSGRILSKKNSVFFNMVLFDCNYQYI